MRRVKCSDSGKWGLAITLELPTLGVFDGQTPWKTSPMKSLGLLKPLPHFASVVAVGSAATISSSDLPCFFRAAIFLASANEQVAIKGELGFVIAPGMG